MQIRPHRLIKRKKTRKIKVGNVYVGGDSTISVQSMTNTLTTDYKSTIKQINLLSRSKFLYSLIEKYRALYPDHVVFLGPKPIIFDSK